MRQALEMGHDGYAKRPATMKTRLLAVTALGFGTLIGAAFAPAYAVDADKADATEQAEDASASKASDMLRSMKKDDGWSAIDSIEIIDPDAAAEARAEEAKAEALRAELATLVEQQNGTMRGAIEDAAGIVSVPALPEDIENGTATGGALAAMGSPAGEDVVESANAHALSRAPEGVANVMPGSVTAGFASFDEGGAPFALLDQSDFPALLKSLQVATVQIWPKLIGDPDEGQVVTDVAEGTLVPEVPQEALAMVNGLFIDVDGHIITVMDQPDQEASYEVVTADGEVLEARLQGYDAGNKLALLKVVAEGPYDHVTLNAQARKSLAYLMEPAQTVAPVIDAAAVKEAAASDIIESQPGYLGISIQGVSDDDVAALGLKKAKGALVALVRPGTAAEQAGLREGDVILAVNGDDLASTQDAVAAIGPMVAGEMLDLVIWRDGGTLPLSAQMGAKPQKAPATGEREKALPTAQAEQADEKTVATDSDTAAVSDEAADDVSEDPGVGDPSLEDSGAEDMAPEATEDAAKAVEEGADIALSDWGLTLHGTGDQAIVKAVEEGSEAASKGLVVGDTILRVAERTVTTAEEVQGAVADAQEADRPAILLLVRGSDEDQTERFIAMRLGGSD